MKTKFFVYVLLIAISLVGCMPAPVSTEVVLNTEITSFEDHAWIFKIQVIQPKVDGEWADYVVVTGWSQDGMDLYITLRGGKKITLPYAEEKIFYLMPQDFFGSTISQYSAYVNIDTGRSDTFVFEYK